MRLAIHTGISRSIFRALDTTRSSWCSSLSAPPSPSPFPRTTVLVPITSLPAGEYFRGRPARPFSVSLPWPRTCRHPKRCQGPIPCPPSPLSPPLASSPSVFRLFSVSPVAPMVIRCPPVLLNGGRCHASPGVLDSVPMFGGLPPRPVRLVVLGSGVGGGAKDTAPPAMVLSPSTR